MRRVFLAFGGLLQLLRHWKLRFDVQALHPVSESLPRYAVGLRSSVGVRRKCLAVEGMAETEPSPVNTVTVLDIVQGAVKRVYIVLSHLVACLETKNVKTSLKPQPKRLPLGFLK